MTLGSLSSYGIHLPFRFCLHSFFMLHLLFHVCYVMSHMVHFLSIWYWQCTHALWGTRRSAMALKYVLYADDTHVYIPRSPDSESNFSSSLENLYHCIAGFWRQMNILFSDNKTNLILLYLRNLAPKEAFQNLFYHFLLTIKLLSLGFILYNFLKRV